MAVYYSVSCPHCGCTVESGKNRHEKYGSPIRTCRRCRSLYLDDNYVEAALLSEKDVKEEKISWPAVIWALIGVVFLIYGIVELFILLCVLGVALLSLGFISILQYIRYNPNTDESFQAELRASKQRLSNPKYVISLYELGYPIPSEIFNEAKSILNYKTKVEIYRETMQSDNYDETRYQCKTFRFLSDAGEGKCQMCFQKDIVKKYRIKNDIGTRDIPICDRCVERFKKHSNIP